MGKRIHLELVPGSVVQMLPKVDAKIGSISLRRIGVYTPTPVAYASECKHIQTICNRCHDTWDEDYYIRNFEHGSISAYATYGCRCNICRNTHSRSY